MRWSATFDDASLFGRLISSVSAVLSAANLKVEEKKVTISGMDESRIAMTSLNTPNSFFQQYEFTPSEEEHTVGINVQKLKSVMRRASSDDGVTLSIDDDAGNKLKVKFFRGVPEESQFERVFTIPLPEKTEEINPEGLSYSVTLEFAPPSDLSAIVSDAAVFAEDLRIETTQEEREIKFIAESGIGSEYEYVANLDEEEAIINYKLDSSVESVASIYSLEFLEDFSKADRVSEMVRLEYSEENPLRLTYNVSGGCTLTFLLAPRVA